jgi:hypothetical protein
MPIDELVLIDTGSASIPHPGRHRLNVLPADASGTVEPFVNLSLIVG